MVQGLISLRSPHSHKITAERLEAAVTGHGMALIARIDHSAAAAKVGLDLRPTEVLIFGNPSAGTLLMQDRQTIGLDLPLKALVWEDESSASWISYQDVDWLATRYGLTPATDATVLKMATLVKAVVDDAVQ